MKQQNWSVVFIELLVVAAGLLLAFQVDRWWENRGDLLREQAYIERLMIEVEDDIGLIEYAIELAEVRLGFADHLMEVVRDPSAIQSHPAMFLAAASQAAFTYTPSLTSHTFEDLRSTGNMGLIRSAEVKRALYDYYGFHHGQQQFMQLNMMIEYRYFVLAAEVLSHEQNRWLQEKWFVVNRDNLEEVLESAVDLEETKAAVERLRGNPELIAWLPRTRHLQREQVLMHGIRLSRARELLTILEANAKLPGPE